MVVVGRCRNSRCRSGHDFRAARAKRWKRVDCIGVFKGSFQTSENFLVNSGGLDIVYLRQGIGLVTCHSRWKTVESIIIFMTCLLALYILGSLLG